MKATLAACADRAVGFGAALLGLAFLFFAARHVFAPSAMEPSMGSVGSAAIVGATTIAPRKIVVVRRRSVVGAVSYAATKIERRRTPRAIVRASPPHPAAGNRTLRLAVVRSALGSTRSHTKGVELGAVVSRASAGRSRVAVAPPPPHRAHRAFARVGPATPRARAATPRRPIRVASSTRTTPRARRTPKPFNRTIRFDTRPALVVVTDASATSLPLAETLPTIVGRRHR